MEKKRWIATARCGLLVIVLLPLTGVALGQQELAVWFAALLILFTLVIRSRKPT